MSLLVHLSLWPWKRTTARSEVAATTGGTELRWPWGMSTTVYGMAYRVRKSSVSDRLASLSQDSCRNSAQIRAGEHRRAHSRRYSLFFRLIVNHGGNWNRTAPSLPAWYSGSRADRKRSHTWSITESSRSLG